VAKAALLDVDGTLIDANYQHAIAWYRAFQEHGIVLPVWRIHRAIGMGGDQLVPALAGDEVEEDKGDDIRESRDEIYEDLIDEVAALPGAREFISHLLDRNIHVVLASSSPEEEIDHYLDLLDVRALVDDWTTKEDVAETKPEPDLVQAALEKAGEEDAVMVGDTKWDVDAATKAGLPTICVMTGGWSRAELVDAGAAHVYESVEELGTKLEETPLA
jgi:HAD superfamily hydrolase (TIGR01549 family)